MSRVTTSIQVYEDTPASTYDVCITRRPERASVSDDYIERFQGCPFDTALRPTSFYDGADAYHSPPASDTVLYEIKRQRMQSQDPMEYMGFLARHDANHPSRNQLREVKWVSDQHSHRLTSREAARDLGTSRHDALWRAFQAVDAETRHMSHRDVAQAGNKYLGEYLGVMCHDISSLHTSESAPVETPGAVSEANDLVDKVTMESRHGKKCWAPNH